jgi:hypothetical protein
MPRQGLPMICPFYAFIRMPRDNFWIGAPRLNGPVIPLKCTANLNPDIDLFYVEKEAPGVIMHNDQIRIRNTWGDERWIQSHDHDQNRMSCRHEKENALLQVVKVNNHDKILHASDEFYMRTAGQKWLTRQDQGPGGAEFIRRTDSFDIAERFYFTGVVDT